MPEFSNRQVTVTALGLAINAKELVYGSMIGPKGSLKSIWAGLVMNSKKAVTYAPGWQWTNFKAVSGTKQFWAALPRANSHHLVMRSMDKTFILLTDPTAAGLYEYNDRAQRRARLATRLPEAHAALAAFLEDYEFECQGEPARMPVLAHWAPVLWEHAIVNSYVGGRSTRGIYELEAWGDCLGAYWINPSYGWPTKIQELIKAGELVW